jgi:hypothetical protein
MLIQHIYSYFSHVDAVSSVHNLRTTATYNSKLLKMWHLNWPVYEIYSNATLYHHDKALKNNARAVTAQFVLATRLRAGRSRF